MRARGTGAVMGGLSGMQHVHRCFLTGRLSAMYSGVTRKLRPRSSGFAQLTLQGVHTMKRLIRPGAALLGLTVALGAPWLPALAHAQMSAVVETRAPSSAEAAAGADGTTVPGWYRRGDEGPFSFRDPRRGLYLMIGGHAGFANSTRLGDDKGCDHPLAFFLGCENARPSDSLGTGGGGSVGIGTRLTPALRVALIATGETGYQFHNETPWLSISSGQAFVEKISIQSYQATANAYLDVAGLLPAGALGGFNPYLMGGMGVALNVTGETREANTFANNPTVTNTYPGGTEESFLWTAGAGVQYRIASGVVADFSYQYVDAGRFRAATGKHQIDGTTGLPFNPPFRPIRGDLETHRLGLAVNIELETIGRWFSGR
jgi:opacity protein-like surface antigen